MHFVGVGGIGMSALAQMCADLGMKVSGTDRGSGLPENRRIVDKLELQGIRIYPQDGSYIADGRPDVLIYSTAIEEDNPDFRAGEGIPRMHRSELLAELMASRCGKVSVAVTGSCGKSTVAAYVAESLLNLGEDPECLNGALVNRFRRGRFAGNYRSGDGRYLVFEADESDKSLLRYRPDYALVLNIGTDHYSREELARVFGRFLNNVGRGAVLEREVYEAVRSFLPPGLPVKVFESATGAPGEYALTRHQAVPVPGNGRADETDVRSTPSGGRSDAGGSAGGSRRKSGVECGRRTDGTIRWCAEFAGGGELILPQPGKHMAVNALAVLAMLEMLGFRRNDVLKALSSFEGVWRRFEFHGVSASGALVYDDYAHNPEKVASALETAQTVSGYGAVHAVFQPHGFRPLGFMREKLFQELGRVMRRQDRFVMLEPFYAGGTADFSPTSAEVIADYRRRGGQENYLHFSDRNALKSHLLAHAGSGDVILVMGARDNSLSDYASSLTAS